MKLTITFLLFALLACQSTQQSTDLQVLSAEDQLKMVEFEKAQKSANTAYVLNLLTSAVNSPTLFCSFMEKASLTTLDSFLVRNGFLLPQSKGYNFNFQALCHYNHASIICISNRVGELQSYQKEVLFAMKIAGANLCETAQRDSFITVKILINDDEAASDLHLISHFLKLKPDDSDFQTAFLAIVSLCDKKTAQLFLKKAGYIENSPNKEYIEYHPEELTHLPMAAVEAVLKKADIEN